MADRSTAGRDPLAPSGAHLAAHGLTVNLTAQGLTVADPNSSGCCDEARHKADTITCRVRGDGSGVRWFFTSWREPLAPASRIADATTAIRAILGERHEGAEVGR